MHLICIYLYHILITRIVYITIDAKYEAYNRSVDIKHQKSDWPQVLGSPFQADFDEQLPCSRNTMASRQRRLVLGPQLTQ